MRDRLDISLRVNHVLSVILLVAAMVFGVLVGLTGERFYLRLATEALILSGLALSIDILLGFTGLLSLGQALYFGVGAYVSAQVLREMPDFWLALGAGMGASLLAGIVGGLIANRVRGVYFALITFGLAQIVSQIVYNNRTLGASDGLIGIPVVDISLGLVTLKTGNALEFFFFVLAVIALIYAALSYVLSTPFGRVMIALKANEQRLPYLGYSTWAPRMVTYVLAAVIAGTVGALYPMLRGFVSPELMFFKASGDALIMVIIGGTGTLVGAILGAILLVAFKSFVGSWTEHHLVVVGLMFMLAVFFMKRGFIGMIKPVIERRLLRQETARQLQAEGKAQ